MVASNAVWHSGNSKSMEGRYTMNVIAEIDNGNYVLVRAYSRAEVPSAQAELLRLARLGQAMDWISVDERLPEVKP